MKETVIQFGEGNFLRGFFDWFLDGLNKNGLYDGKAVIVQPRAGGKTAPLNEQACKYNLYLRGIVNGEIKEEHTLIESVSRGVDPYKNYQEYIDLAKNPDFRHWMIIRIQEFNKVIMCNQNHLFYNSRWFSIYYLRFDTVFKKGNGDLRKQITVLENCTF